MGLQFFLLAFAILGGVALVAVIVAYTDGRDKSTEEKEAIIGRLVHGLFIGWLFVAVLLFFAYLVALDQLK